MPGSGNNTPRGSRSPGGSPKNAAALNAAALKGLGAAKAKQGKGIGGLAKGFLKGGIESS
jgi:hypothetical protein